MITCRSTTEPSIFFVTKESRVRQGACVHFWQRAAGQTAGRTVRLTAIVEDVCGDVLTTRRGVNRYINWQRQSSTWKKGVCQQLATHRSALVPSREPRHGDCELFLKHVSEVTRWDSKTVAGHCPSAPPAEPGGEGGEARPSAARIRKPLSSWVGYHGGAGLSCPAGWCKVDDLDRIRYLDVDLPWR